MYYRGPIIFGVFVSLKIEAVRGQIFKGANVHYFNCVLLINSNVFTKIVKAIVIC